MKKLKNWINEHQKEIVGFGIFLALFVVLTGGVLYFSFVEPPKETKITTGQRNAVAVKETKGKAEDKENDKTDKKLTDTGKDAEDRTEVEKNNRNDKTQEKKSEEEEKNEQEKKQEPDQKVESDKATEKATIPASSGEASTVAELPADTGAPAPVDTQPESSNIQTSQPEPTTVQETPAQGTLEQPQPATPESEHERQPVWHEPVYEQQWVVDQAAWDETVSEPIYEEVSRAICNGCGADITDCIDEHGYNAMMSGNMSCGAYHVVTETIQTGTNTYTIHHDEIGHYENVLVQEGYWE